MIEIYERSLCQTYRDAYRQGIKLCDCLGVTEALNAMEELTENSYRCFGVGPDGTVYDLGGSYPRHLAEEVGACSA